MKRLVMTALLVSTGAMAEDAAKIEQPAPAPVCPLAQYSSLSDLWNKTDTGNGIKQALVNGTPSLEFMAGYEYSDLDNSGLHAAQALITRTRLNYQTGAYKGFDAFVQAQYVGPINDHYSYPGGGNPNYDVVADPEKFRFQQAYLAYTGYDSHARIGAQEINLDNERFIGNVAWRLNAQSFNAASVANHSISNLTLFYAYTDSINDTLGSINHDRQYHLLNAEYKVCENNKASAFAYLQRNDGAGLDQLDTYGLRTWGKNDIVSHDVMVALQRDAYYGSVFGELDLDPIDVGGGIEYISGGNKDDERFQTLDGTAHKFNGWADQFLGTGGGLEGGLADLYGQVSATAFEKLKLTGVYHWFHTNNKTDANNFSGKYGQEIDLMAKYPVCKNFDVLTAFAYYMKGDNNADNFTNDETAFWLRGTLRF
ncbi:MAG: alginate export family protein [Kiritimatiellales bacterium]|nr:alginate export family protein [Kiritimatiellales bacterium]